MKHTIINQSPTGINKSIYVELKCDTNLEESALKNAENPTVTEKKLPDDYLKAISFDGCEWWSFLNYNYQGGNIFIITYLSKAPSIY